ncbi:MAG: hypothetical protein M3071_00020 [Actinomycetota bacterium]|nr:hypothetical protein [Actinomycetota bacterium]
MRRFAAAGVIAALVLAASTFAASVKPKLGRYSGHVESVFAIGFRVSSDGKRITVLQTDFQAPCGVLSPKKVVTRFPTIAIDNGRFGGSKGAYRIAGRFSAPAAASGMVSGQEKLIGFTKKPKLCKFSVPFSATRVGK